MTNLISRLKTFISKIFSYKSHRRHQHGVVANVLDYEIVISEFEPQSSYYVHFQTNIFRKGMKPLILQFRF